MLTTELLNSEVVTTCSEIISKTTNLFCSSFSMRKYFDPQWVVRVCSLQCSIAAWNFIKSGPIKVQIPAGPTEKGNNCNRFGLVAFWSQQLDYKLQVLEGNLWTNGHFTTMTAIVKTK